ncbi:hypothetical protein DTO027B5_9075 [Paecilomyces variotii]|nr:hypothetical protein DTO195F2_1740 [Paecilomyces variotii]KAJ9319930.1 hypothetical protein DTO027B3_9064 [Paecilomyces variotii]KAJ9327075.1 hypothetical protein DTO027B5_9075 [Paecilomyces variotii]KAJ9348589.1 hypothetical protein DTO280E4_9296 [Paecilomyces variotii]KAJ9366536.1 hypothetical protein DTO282E5_8760 [Paecilomyces variotii]
MLIPPLLTSLFSAAGRLYHFPKQQSDLENVNSILCRYHISTTTRTNRLHPPRRIPLRPIIPPPSLRIRPHTQDNGPSPRRLIRELWKYHGKKEKEKREEQVHGDGDVGLKGSHPRSRIGSRTRRIVCFKS